MNKELSYLIDYLKVSKVTPFEQIDAFLVENIMKKQGNSDAKGVRISAAKEGIKIEQKSESALKRVDEILQEVVPKEIKDAKNQLFETLINSNFKKKKEQFNKVETSIYKCLEAYVYTLCRALEVFYCFNIEKQQDPELFVVYGKKMHEVIEKRVFNQEEKAVIGEQLNLLLGVYLSMYSQSMYK